MIPKNPTSLTRAQPSFALPHVPQEKEEWIHQLDGCSDERKQREFISKIESSSPALSTDAVFVVVTIPIKENRDVVVMDIPVPPCRQSFASMSES